MASKKFGTFGGVFTPSILTILGVIMYMRLGWVVGNAGLYGAIILIVIAHVISVTTGLSISSIATDKKVGAGGVYYVLSRSLGLPIGGAIGITLWIATALSIALYLVGFAESFNAYLGIDTDINGLRITGSAALGLLATIAIISTAVAIKTQYFIMAAIGISLVSIFAGSWEFAPTEVPLFGPSEGVSMMTVFAILFPAVTGFTAGIAMSGDLKDPKKSIPNGTIAAIVVGFVVYMVLAVFLAYAINPELLRSDYNVLMKIALFAPAVVAGIWGATLSSALGGILGGPRILQAMSLDRITPRLFSKGVGKDREPRNALLLTLLIAEGGVLIGELDMIAEVCSMFYLAAYGFINLSFFLESWASADFSPTFKVKRWIGLLGFIATFAVMFKLNAGAMVAAFVVIGGIYAYLQRKQLALSSGDVWTSVWSSLVMKGLKRMDASEDSSRNWKPNILLFSGGTANRPHLIEMSKAIAGNVGMVSNFDLIENPKAEVLFPKHKQAVQDSVLAEHGIFGRQMEVQNVFKGIETIASTYGFSGVDPNTVMLGWAKNTKDPIWFAQMTQRLIALDYNVLYLDYDTDRKFGNYEQIDIWWYNLQNNAELTLNLVKFIGRSPAWNRAKIRVILINDTGKEGFERRIHKMLDNYRIDASVKVINNLILRKSAFELMETESEQADLILAGIPEIPQGGEREFVEKTTEMFRSIATTLLVKTSSTLGEDIGSADGPSTEELAISPEASTARLIPLPALKDPVAQEVFATLSDEVEGLTSDLVEEELASVENIFLGFVNDCRNIALDLFESNRENLEQDLMVHSLQEYLQRVDLLVSEDIPYLEERLHSLTEKLLQFKEQIKPRLKGRIRIEEKRVAYRRRTRSFLNQHYLDFVRDIQLRIGTTTAAMKDRLRDGLVQSEDALRQNTSSDEAQLEALRKSFDRLSREIAGICRQLNVGIRNQGRELLDAVLQNLTGKQKHSSKEKHSSRERKELKAELLEYPLYWHRNSVLLAAGLATDIKLHRVQLIITQAGAQLSDEIQQSMITVTRDRLEQAREWLERLKEEVSFDLNDLPQIDQPLEHDDIRVHGLLARAEVAGQELPEQLELMTPESLSELGQEQGESVESVTIDSLGSYTHLLNDVLARPVQRQLTQAYQLCMEVLSQVQGDIHQMGQQVSAQKDAPASEEILEMGEQTRTRLDALSQKFEVRQKELLRQIEDLTLAANASMNTSTLLEHAIRVLPSRKTSASASGLKQWLGKARDRFSNLTDRLALVLRPSEGRTEGSSQLSDLREGYTDMHDALRQYTDSLKIPAAVNDKVPFYYKQLFMGRQAPNIDNLRHLDAEVDRAITILRPPQGQGSNLIVLGAPHSGKTFFAESVAKEVSGGRVIKIKAPVAGSTSITDLRKTLTKHLGQPGKEGSVFQNVASETLFVLEDIELWWSRSDQRNAALRYLIKLINNSKLQGRVILTCNHYAFQLMESQLLLTDLTLPRIALKGLERDALKDLLLERHMAGGMALSLGGKDLHELSKKDVRRLAERYFESSRGVTGIALRQWLNNIVHCDPERIHMDLPALRPLPPMEDKEWLVLVAQFIIHKHLDAQRIQDLFAYRDPEKAGRMLRQLVADGILEDVMGATYQLNPLVQSVFTAEAERCGMI